MLLLRNISKAFQALCLLQYFLWWRPPFHRSISGAGFSEMIIVQANGVDVRRLVWTAINSALALRLSQDLKSSRSWRVAFGDCGGSSRVGHRRFFLSGAHVLNGVIDRNKTWSFLYQFAGSAIFIGRNEGGRLLYKQHNLSDPGLVEVDLFLDGLRRDYIPLLSSCRSAIYEDLRLCEPTE
jgi:hypothetical protein